MLDAELSAWVCSVDVDFLSASVAGRRYDDDFLAELPGNVDPSGENGEFHTFVEWAPGWDRRVRVKPSRLLERYDFSFCELEPVPDGAISRENHKPFDYYSRLEILQEYVDSHLDARIGRDTAASVASMTPDALSHFFRERVGMTFTSWLARHRVQRAAGMSLLLNVARQSLPPA